MAESYIHLNWDQAERIFASPYDWRPMIVIDYWFDELKKENDEDKIDALIEDIRFLMLVIKTYHNYKSKEAVRWFVMGLIRRYIANFYAVDPKPRPLENFKFFYMLIFRFRNIKHERSIAKHFDNPEFFNKLQRALFENGVFQEYQGTLFNEVKKAT